MLQVCAQRFRSDLVTLQDGSLAEDGWNTPYDRLALIILADQLSRCKMRAQHACCRVQFLRNQHYHSPVPSSRNIYRGSPRAFASDKQALQWAAELQDSGAAKQLPATARLFSIMPFMHSEEVDVQVRLSLASQLRTAKLCCCSGRLIL